MEFAETQVFNIEGAMRGMRFPMQSKNDSNGETIGEKDMDLAKRLFKASEVDNLAHSKFLRQILVSVDIDAPLYFWSEMDTYKIGTTANSESTMHRLLKDISIGKVSIDNFETGLYSKGFIEDAVIPHLISISKLDISNILKIAELKRCLPTSFKQKRHWTANYEVIRNIYNQRKKHRLTEWNTDYVNWVKTLPYAEELIIGKGGGTDDC